ncbi:MAG: hypothetical protein HYS12_23125 [Planctomycetes bacterium]|nr:hypothetical protein [Planctomycetota bacterium]
MRTLCKVSLSLALVALLAAPALAQFPGGGFGQSLLLNKSVQDELKLDKEQKTKLDEVSKKARDKMREAFQGGFDREKFQAITKEINEEATKAASLNTNQKKRLAEIQLQQTVRFAGPAAFGSEDTQKQLKLTDEQKDAIKTILKETADKIKEETKDLEMNREGFQKRREITQKLNKEAMGKVAAKLTKEQKATWTKMLGEPFEVKFERPGRPGGGARPQRNDL